MRNCKHTCFISIGPTICYCLLSILYYVSCVRWAGVSPNFVYSRFPHIIRLSLLVTTCQALCNFIPNIIKTAFYSYHFHNLNFYILLPFTCSLNFLQGLRRVHFSAV